jgi:hypothetical protein
MVNGRSGHIYTRVRNTRLNLGMLRIAAIVLAVAVSYDLYMLAGKYTSVANQMATSILRHFGLL